MSQSSTSVTSSHRAPLDVSAVPAVSGHGLGRNGGHLLGPLIVLCPVVAGAMAIAGFVQSTAMVSAVLALLGTGIAASLYRARRMGHALAAALARCAALERISREEDDRREKAEEAAATGAAWRDGLERDSAALETRLCALLALLDEQFARMRDTARMLNGVAGETIRQVSTAEEAALEAAAYVGDVAHSAVGLAAAEREISVKVLATSAVTRQARDTARDVDGRVMRLADAAKRIEDVVRVVETIASRTNLLALNATIEAARAGEAGRGFAVVAQEVKALAAQTATCTASISELATSIRSAAEEALLAVAVITGVMGEIDTSTQTIAGAVEEQGVATAGISEHALQMQRGTDIVVAAVNAVTGTAAETSVAALEVEDATRAVAAAVRDLSGEVNAFIAAVRPARIAA